MSHQYKRIMSFSNPKNNKIMIKNMRGMNDPAFQSNNTLKQYINKKLNLYEEPEINSNPKPQSLLKFKEKATKKKVKNRNTKNNKNLDFTDNSFYSKTQTHNLSHYNNASLNNLRKKQDKIKGKTKNSFLVFKHNNNININNNRSSKRQTLNKNKKESNNVEGNKSNKFFDIILTPDNNDNKKDNSKTTPLNDLNKIKGIYKRKNILLNKSYKSHSRDYSSIIKKEKEKQLQYKSPQNYNKNNSKLKKEIYNIINHKPLNQTYFKENSRKPKYYENNLFSKSNNYFRSENNEYADNLKDLLLKDESFNESECPEPMPYVKKYSDIINIKKEKENISESTINIINNFNININKNLNDLNEPVEEKNIPLPVSQIHNKKNKYGNNNKRFVYMNRIKFIKK